MKKLPLVLMLIFLCGCAYTFNKQLPTVLTSEDELFAIQPNTQFTAVKDAGQLPKQYLVNETLIAMRMGNYQSLLEKSDTRFFKQSRITKKQAMWGGGIVSLLGIIASVLWNMRKKFKVEGNIKAEA
jgi:hypothetical protein